MAGTLYIGMCRTAETPSGNWPRMPKAGPLLVVVARYRVDLSQRRVILETADGSEAKNP